MMKLMPFMLLFLFVNAPAGLVIYWSWSNFLTIVQQWYIKRRYRAREA
jgi:YidC/Oxa1 family membrane protein insertase